MRRAITALLCLVLALVPGTGAGAQQTDDTQQRRAFWVDAFNEGIYDQGQVDQLVQDALAANANTLIVQVGRRFDCFCNDAVYPRTDAAIAPAPYDPLAAIVAAGHAAGLEVHAWINATTVWNSAVPPSSPDHVFNAHGPDAEGSDNWLNRRVDGRQLMGANAYLDPANPDAVAYVVDAIRSVVEAYDVDGVNLDYIRYPDFNTAGVFANDWGYTDVALERFAAATGRDDRPAPTDEEWAQWRRDQVTALVRRIHLGIFDVDPSVTLSVNAITYAYGPQTYGGWEQTRPYAEVLQDWQGWLAEGIIDEAVAMNYKRDWMPDQAQMFREWTTFMADNQHGRHAINGPALYLNSLEDSLRQIDVTFTPTAAGNTVRGWSGYSYANPSMAALGGTPQERAAARAELAEALTAPGGPFAQPAEVPDMPWRSSPTTGHVAGTVVTRRDGAADQVPVELISRGQVVATTVTDGSGWFGFIDVEPGRYHVSVDRQAVEGRPIAHATVSTGELTEVEIRPDRLQ